MGVSRTMAYSGAVDGRKQRTTMSGYSVRLFCLAGLLSGMPGARLAQAAEPYDPWPGLVQDIFKNRPMQDGIGVIAVEMPYRAEDAAIVPVTLRNRLSPDDGR